MRGDDAALTLLSYVWPGQDERFRTLRDALATATTFPVAVDRGEAGVWLPAQLAETHPGVATVGLHSVFLAIPPARDAGVDRRAR